MPQNILKMCLFLICRAAFQFLALTRAINATPLIAPPTQLQGQRQTQFTRLQKAQPGKKSDVIYISIGRLAFSISTLSVCNSQQVKTKGKPGWKYHDSESQRDRGKDTRSEQQLKNIQPLFTAWKQYKVKSQNGNKCKYFDGKLKGGGHLEWVMLGQIWQPPTLSNTTTNKEEKWGCRRDADIWCSIMKYTFSTVTSAHGSPIRSGSQTSLVFDVAMTTARDWDVPWVVQ